MANWRSFGGQMLHCRRSMLQTWCNCSNPAGFHHSTCGGGGGLLSPVRSSEYFIRLGGRSVGVLKKGAIFSLIQRFFSSSSGVVIMDGEEARGGISTTVLGPLPLRSAPCLMLPAGSGLVDEGDESYKLVTMEAKDGERDYYQFFSIREKKVVKMKKNNHRLLIPWQREVLPPDEAICFGSSRGWLAFIHPRNCSLYLFNPFIHSYLPYLPLPPIQTLPCVISCVRYNPNIHNSSSSSSSSSINNSNNNNNIVTEFTIRKQFSPISSQDLSQAPFFKKIVLSSAPSPFPSNHGHGHGHGQHMNNNYNKYSSSECTVMVIQGYEENKLAFSRIGDTAWTALDGAGESYQDIIYFSKDQNFYAFYNRSIEAWDLRNPASPKNTLIISHLPPRLRHRWGVDRYLVESSGELLMVCRYYSHNFDDHGKYHPGIINEDYSRPKKTIMFDVYKLDFVNKEWLLLPSLGDRALFIGLNDSVSVSTGDFPGLTNNSIYFTSPDAEFLEDSHDLGVFNLEDNTITPIYHYDLKIQLPSLWVVPTQLSNEQN